MLVCDSVLPFDTSGRLDTAALRAHVLWLRAHGVTGLAPGLSESFALDTREREDVLRTVRDAAPDATLLAPIWHPSAARVLKLAALAAELGATAVVIPPAVLCRVPEASVGEWFRTLARRITLPILAWHDPRFDNPLAPALCASLLANGISGVLDASGDHFRVQRLAAAHTGAVWAAGDGVARHHDTLGLAGVVSRVANAYPELAARLYLEHDTTVLDAVTQRARLLARAGGVPALKRLLCMNARLPLVGVEDEAFVRLPQSSFA
jgi:4-hydroxy-tetrahydrodipicolinate synthase